MNFQDKTLVCVECSQSFTFSAEDQSYHSERQYTDPKRCPSCRQARRASRDQRGGGFGAMSDRQMYPVTCAQCGKAAEVPFQPRGDRPVYCSDCYRERRGSGDY